jgi:hypothetical protein
METPTVEPVISKVDAEKKKEKKPRTEAQIAAQQKALATLKEKRDKQKAEETKLAEEAKTDELKKKELEKIQYEKAKYQKKKLPPAPSYITSVDLERFKNELIGSLSGKETKVVEKPVERVVEKVVEKPVVVERVIEKVVEKPVPVVQQKLTGHELLDRIFFNK